MSEPLVSGLSYIISNKSKTLKYYVKITDDNVEMVNKYIKNDDQSSEYEFGIEYDPAQQQLQEALISFEIKMNVTKVDGGGRRPKNSQKRSTRRRSSKRQSRKMNKRRKY
jgi:hypothetical protein